MKTIRTLSLCALALSFAGCWTSIHTVAPTTEPVVPVTTVYSTQVTTPSNQRTTTTVTVTSYNDDLSFYLDLQAVAAAFAESRSVEEFERIINSSRYMINNLDINRDGYVDYLRVIEIRQGYYHTFLIQACLGPQMFQDVATLVAERRSDRLYVELIGDRYLYGYNYVVRPVFVQRPPLWDHFGRPTYNPWTSPYYHGHWPSYYTYTRPVYLNHYQAYVNTYMTNHHYCHHCDYPNQPYWDGYRTMTQPHHHNDYANQHPNDSFEKRIEHGMSANGSGVSYRNAGQLRDGVSRSQQGNQNNGQGRVSQNAGTTPTNTRSSQSAYQQSGTYKPANAQTQSAASTRVSQSTAQTQQPSGRGSQTSSQSSGRSSQATSQSSGRSSQATSQSSGRSSQTTGTSQSSSRPSAVTTVRQPSTSVSSRVSRTGEVRDTKVQTTDASGRTTSSSSSGRQSVSTGNSGRQSSTSSSGRQSSTSSSSSSSRQSGSSSNGGGRSSGNSGSAPRR